MIRQFLKEKTAVTALAILLKTALSHAQQVPIQFIDQLASDQQEEITKVAKKLLQDQSTSGTVLFHFLSDEIDTNTTTLDSFQIKDLTTSTSLYCDQIPTMTLNSNTHEDRLKSFLNLLGFGGKFFDKPVTIVSALTQYLPEIHIRTINGIKNIFFTDPAFTDTNFAENISYYDSLSGLSHLVPTSVSSQRLHDLLLAYAFSGKKNPDLKVTGLCERGANGVRLPVIEIIGNFLALKLIEHINESEQVIFSGSGFSGAIAQEVAYQLKLKRVNQNLNVITTQAMRYLTDDFIKDYDHVLGWKNVFSINTNRDWSININFTYQTVKFGCLGQQIRLVLTPPKNTWFSTLAQNSGFWQSQATENQKGVIFKNQINPRTKLNQVLGKIKKGLFQTVPIEDRDFAKLAEVMDSLSKNQTRSSSNALATLVHGGLFLKTSIGRLEHDNLVTIRAIFNQQVNTPILVKLTDSASMALPASYYDPIYDVTITLAHAVGDRSAHDNLKNILDQKDFTQAATIEGQKLGEILAALHLKTGCLCHGDFHLNNIRFDRDGHAYIIDIETLANGIVDGNRRDLNGFRDILDLIAKTTSHMYKSRTYGANKGWGLITTTKDPTETEKAFATGVLKGYIISLDPQLLEHVKKQYRDFQVIYGGDINKFLHGGFFSAYSNTIFTQVFKCPIIEELLT
jgi:tRNA A-37 threonylcarbamoyl transferase component Bud32